MTESNEIDFKLLEKILLCNLGVPIINDIHTTLSFKKIELRFEFSENKTNIYLSKKDDNVHLLVGQCGNIISKVMNSENQYYEYDFAKILIKCFIKTLKKFPDTMKGLKEQLIQSEMEKNEIGYIKEAIKKEAFGFCHVRNEIFTFWISNLFLTCCNANEFRCSFFVRHISKIRFSSYAMEKETFECALDSFLMGLEYHALPYEIFELEKHICFRDERWVKQYGL